MKKRSTWKHTVCAVLTAALLLSSVPLTGATAYAAEPKEPAGSTLLLKEDFEGTYADSAALNGQDNGNNASAIAGFSTVFTGTPGMNEKIELEAANTALSSTVLKISQGSTAVSTTGVKRIFSQSGIAEGTVTVEMDFASSNVTKNGILLQVLDTDGKVIADIQNKNNPSSGYSGAYACFVDAAGAFVPVGTNGDSKISNSTGYHLKAVLDLGSGTANYYLSSLSGSALGELLNQPFKQTPAAAGLQALTSFTKSGASGSWTVAIDNLLVYHSLLPKAPEGLAAAAGNSKVDLSWNTVAGATYYSVKRSLASGSGYTVISPRLDASQGVTAVTYTDASVMNGTTYYYVVTATGAAGESASSAEASATPAAGPLLPGTPQNVSAAAGNGQVALSWAAVNGAASYTVKRATTAGGPYAAVGIGLTGTGYTDTGLANNQTYYYVVSAVNAAGEGPESSAASAMPGDFLIGDDFEGSALGELPAGYRTPLGSGVITKFDSGNNIAVIANGALTNSFGNTSATVAGNDSRVLWINDGTGRGGLNKPFTPVTAEAEQGITASLEFMQAKRVGDSYMLELLDSNNKTALSFNINSSPVAIKDNVWYKVAYVADVKANTADLYVDGVYMGNAAFSAAVTDIASLNVRMAGSSTGSAYVDNIRVYGQHITVPQALTGEGSDKKAVLSWNAASGAEAYAVYRSTAADGTYGKIAEGISTNTYTDSANLVNETAYYYRVTAVRAGIESGFSNMAEITPTDTQPPVNKVVNLHAAIRDGQLTVAWEKPAVEEKRDVEFYTVERATNPEGPFMLLTLNGKSRIYDSSYLDLGLRTDVSYYYRVTPGNAGGMGPSELLQAVSPAPALQAPVLLQTEPAGGKAELAWTTVPGAAAYHVARSTVNGGPYERISGDAGVAGTSYTDETATIGTAYYYVVTAANAKQESRSSNQRKVLAYAAPAGAPGVPADVRGEVQTGKVALTWTDANGAESYRVERKTPGGVYELVGTATEPAFADTSASTGTAYTYQVTAVNAAGASAPSAEIQALAAKVLKVDSEAVADGATVFNTIQSAVNAVSASNTERVVISIAPGRYTEKLVVTSPYITLSGAGMDETVISYGDYAGTSATTGQTGHTGNTFLSQTVDVKADYFQAFNLTIENSSGPRSKVAQAVALSLKSDMAVLEGVRLKGYQDTLYNGLNGQNAGRHYIANSIIEGDVDFIFGEAPTVVLDNVTMLLVSQEGGGGHITAAAQKNEGDTGYVILNSRVEDGTSALGAYDLGRPWKDYADVSFINTFINSENMLSAGWVTACAGTCKDSQFSEYNSYGPGAQASSRTTAVMETGSEADKTIPRLFGGWDPTVATVLPEVIYRPSLSSTYARFDGNPAERSNVYLMADTHGQTLQSAALNGAPLPASAYAAEGDVYVLRQEYLSGLPSGTARFVFHFDNADVEFPVQVADTTAVELGRQTLAANDGWAALGTGTTGGSAASPANVYYVTKRSELVKAVSGNTPKIVYVSGTIDMNVDDNDRPVDMEFYKDPAYDLDAYLAAYDPAVWGENLPSGDLEAARARSAGNQGARIKITVGSNTTLAGLPGTKAKILGGNVNLDKVDNIIIRNIEFANTFDYFPQWDPTDGDYGNWNSAYDNISVKGSTHVWVSRNTFSDTGGLDDPAHTYFGRKFQQHDGAVDITNAADLVTVSYNYFHDHDKLSLVGGSDQAAGDDGKLRVTYHHNYFKNVGQRAPRVRFGQVHVYNNYFEGSAKAAPYPSLYFMGIGYKSQIYAENNVFQREAGALPQSLIQVSAGGTALTDTGSVLNGAAVKIAAAYNASAAAALTPVNWAPILHTSMDNTRDVPKAVFSEAGSEGTLEWVDNSNPEESSDDSVSSGTGAPSAPPATPSSKVQLALGAAVPTVLEDGRKADKFMLKDSDVEKALQGLKTASGETPVLAVEANGNAPVTLVELGAAALEAVKAKAPDAVLAVNTAYGTFNLPVRALDLDSLAAQLKADTSGIVLTIHVGTAETAAAGTIANLAAAKGKLLGVPVDFAVTASAKGTAVEVTEFGTQYVQRVITTGETANLSLATAMKYDPVTKTLQFVPAVFTRNANGVQAVIKHPANGIFVFIEAAEQTFADLAGHWAAKDAELLIAKGIIDGIADDRYAPEGTLTRGELAALLVRSAGLAAQPGAGVLSDVKADDWFAGYVQAALSAGLVDGFEDGTFRAGTAVTREQLAVMLVRAMTLAGYTPSVSGASAAFADSDTISGWAKDAVRTAQAAGLVNGLEDGTFRPQGQATRAEAAVMIKRFLLAVGFINE